MWQRWAKIIYNFRPSVLALPWFHQFVLAAVVCGANTIPHATVGSDGARQKIHCKQCGWTQGRAYERKSWFRVNWWHILVWNLMFPLRYTHCRTRIRIVQMTGRARLEEQFYTTRGIYEISGLSVTTLGQNYLWFLVGYLGITRVSCVRFGWGCLWCESYTIRKSENPRGAPENALEKV